MSKLRECPFCGGEAEFKRKGTARASNQVGCTCCGADLEDGATFNHESAWNDRPREKALEKENEILVAYNKELEELNSGIGEELIRLKKEIEDMKVKYNHCCGTTLL